MVEAEDTEIEIQGRKVKGPKKDVVKVYMDATTINSEKNTGQGKLRGIPTMTTKIHLPDPLLTNESGWSTFAAEYNAAIAKVRNIINPK
jgi:hypothetical protein